MMDFYLGTYTRNLMTGESTGSEGIYLCGLDESGSVEIRRTFSQTENPSFLAWEPRRRLLAAASEQLEEKSMVDLYHAGADGALTLLDRLPTHGAACCHVAFSPDGRYLAGVHYGGEVFTAALSLDGKFDSRLTVFRHSGQGADPVRQEGPHAHSIQFLRSRPRAFACDLGIDQIVAYDTGVPDGLRPAPGESLAVPVGSGPRHMALTRDEQWMYVVCELGNTVLTCALDGGKLSLRQSLSTLPQEYQGANLAADIHLSTDETRLYISNRGHNSLAQYLVGPDHMLTLERHIPCQGRDPRNFALIGPQLLCANQSSNDVTVLHCGTLVARLQVPSPVCIAPAWPAL